MHVLLQIDLALKYKSLEIGFNDSHNKRADLTKSSVPVIGDVTAVHDLPEQVPDVSQ